MVTTTDGAETGEKTTTARRVRAGPKVYVVVALLVRRAVRARAVRTLVADADMLTTVGKTPFSLAVESADQKTGLVSNFSPWLV